MSELGSPTFDATIECRERTAIVHAVGDIDIASASALDERLGEARREPVELVVVDLSEVTLLDSTGLGVLIAHREQLSKLAHPIDLRVVIADAPIGKVFTVTGLDQIFSIYPTLDLALSSVDPQELLRLPSRNVGT